MKRDEDFCRAGQATRRQLSPRSAPASSIAQRETPGPPDFRAAAPRSGGAVAGADTGGHGRSRAGSRLRATDFRFERRQTLPARLRPHVGSPQARSPPERHGCRQRPTPPLFERSPTLPRALRQRASYSRSPKPEACQQYLATIVAASGGGRASRSREARRYHARCGSARLTPEARSPKPGAPKPASSTATIVATSGGRRAIARADASFGAWSPHQQLSAAIVAERRLLDDGAHGALSDGAPADGAPADGAPADGTPVLPACDSVLPALPLVPADAGPPLIGAVAGVPAVPVPAVVGTPTVLPATPAEQRLRSDPRCLRRPPLMAAVCPQLHCRRQRLTPRRPSPRRRLRRRRRIRPHPQPRPRRQPRPHPHPQCAVRDCLMRRCRLADLRCGLRFRRLGKGSWAAPPRQRGPLSPECRQWPHQGTR